MRVLSRIPVWLMPIASIAIITFIAVLLQSCGAIHLDRIQRPYTASEITTNLRLSYIVFGATLVVGTIAAYFIYKKVSELERRLDELKKS